MLNNTRGKNVTIVRENIFKFRNLQVFCLKSTGSIIYGNYELYYWEEFGGRQLVGPFKNIADAVTDYETYAYKLQLVPTPIRVIHVDFNSKRRLTT